MKETKWIVLALVALLSLSLSAMVACDDDDDDDDDDNDDGGNASDACRAYVDECAADSGYEYCDYYDNAAAVGDCFDAAYTDFFNCVIDAGCIDTDETCANALENDLLACI